MDENRSGRSEFPVFCIGALFGILIACIIGGGIYVGIRVQQKKEANEAARLEAELERENPAELMGEEFTKKVGKLEAMLHKYYYKDDWTNLALEDGMLKGMMNAVGDPYTVYYTPEELKEFSDHTQGVYYGIGSFVELDKETQYPKVTRPLAGGPAEEAGLRPGDLIYQINGESTFGMSLDKAVSLIKGPEGTTVKLSVIRDQGKEVFDLEVERRKVETPTVTQKMFDDGMAYIQLTNFEQVSTKQFKEAMDQCRKEGMKGLIVDLRGNPGGAVNVVVDIARMFLPEGLVVYMEQKDGKREEYFCDGKNEFQLPLVVLIDGNSASASELFSSAIQDYEKGVLVGTQSFGKGIVQQVFSLRDGSAVKMTIGSYYSPKGRNIHGIGVTPDIECPFDSDRYYDDKYDNQLEKAKEVLKQLMNGEKPH